jgi:predicted RNA-binding protein with PUA-like domain
MVDISFIKKFDEVVTLDVLRQKKTLEDMLILRKGNRLSVTPVTKKEFEMIERMGSK